MSVDNDKIILSADETEDKASLENVLQDSEETLQITINRNTNEAILTNPKDNRIIKLKANFEDAIEEKLEEIEDDKDEIPPLTPEQFEDGLTRLDALGLTFSVDLFPSIIPKNESSADIIDADEFENLQEEYPTLPREVGFVAHNIMTGATRALELLGGSSSFEKNLR